MNNSHYYPALTGVRAVAAWMVYAHHFIPFDRSTQLFLYNFTFELHTGVSIFFVLSGFLIYHRYQSVKKEKGWMLRYLRNRFARIFPLLFILTTVTYIFGGPGVRAGMEVVPAFLLNITLLNGYFDSLKFMGIAQAWTLTIEETFYVLAPLIMMLRSKIHLLIVPVIALSIGFLLFDSHFMLTYTFFGRCTEFCAGIFLALIFGRKEQLTQGIYTYAGVFMVLFAILFMAFVRGDTNEVLTYPEIAVNNFILPVCVATLFYGLLTESTWVERILSGKFFQVMGNSSYAFYLVHIGIIQQFLSREVTGNTIVLFVVLNLVAVALYYSVERPLQKIVRGT